MKEFWVTVSRVNHTDGKISVWGNPNGKLYRHKTFTVNSKEDLKAIRDYMKEAFHTTSTRGLADILHEGIPMLWFGGWAEDNDLVVEDLIDKYHAWLERTSSSQHKDWVSTIVSKVIESHGVEIADEFAKAVSKRYNVEVYTPSEVLSSFKLVA